MPTRRQFLQQSSTLAALVATGVVGATGRLALGNQEKRKLKLLILGGTGFLGPCIVRRAVERGHTMTLFNRGKTDPTAFPDLEKFKGDRNVDADLEQLAGREWDAVIDTSAYFPRQTRASARLFAATVGQYLLISTISVYRPLDAPNADESAPLMELPANVDAEKLQTIGANYGALKAMCEQEAEKAMPGQVTNIRPGLIVGPDDDSDRFTYWPLRVAAGGEVLAPGTADDRVQIMDVRDLANFVIHCAEKTTVGVMNATGPKGGLPIGELLAACKRATKSDATFTFVPDDFLDEQKISGWSDLPTWISPRQPGGGLVNLNVERAVAAGLAFRSAEETARDTLDWFRTTQKGRELRGGLKRDAETKALAAWHAKKS